MSTLSDPRERFPKPPYKKETEQPTPGEEASMRMKPDCGETSYRGSGRLEGAAALITGGDSGIDRAVAIAFAREGADVLIAYLAEEETDARETASFIEKAGRRCVLVPGDISREAHCKELVERAVREFGRLDVLVNNAAYQRTVSDVSEITEEDLHRTFGTNIFAMFYLVKAAVPHMKPGASIINTASIEAYQPDFELLPYATTKGAIVTFTKGLVEGLAKKGIRANAVAPGPIWTPLIPTTMGTTKAKVFGEQTPIGRAGQPAELAPIYVLLASNDASYITGQIYGCTGGGILA